MKYVNAVYFVACTSDVVVMQNRLNFNLEMKQMKADQAQ